jgi:NAD(P)-dependent dehydrogenase (short-subunit alcohol dehydrogenase family)
MPDSRFIVITGASRGLGRAMTDGFIDAGQTVVGCARSNEAVAELGNQFGPPHRFEVVDVSDHQQVGKWTTSILEEFGPPDILINSAAVINKNAPLWQVSPDEFSRVVDINIKGVHNTIYHLVPSMIQRGSGVIVNFSSYWGRSTSSDVAAYCTTKWAIEGLSRGLADDLPNGMASVAFNPGVIHTEMLESCFAEGAASYPSPQQWAEVAVPYILELGPEDNGQAVTVPGF